MGANLTIARPWVQTTSPQELNYAETAREPLHDRHPPEKAEIRPRPGHARGVGEARRPRRRVSPGTSLRHGRDDRESHFDEGPGRGRRLPDQPLRDAVRADA